VEEEEEFLNHYKNDLRCEIEEEARRVLLSNKREASVLERALSRTHISRTSTWFSRVGEESLAVVSLFRRSATPPCRNPSDVVLCMTG